MKRKMSFFIFFALLLTTIFSCKKESTNSGYYVKIKQDGNWINFATVAGELGPDLLDPSVTDLVIAAESTGNTEAFRIALQGTTIPTGTYDTDDQSTVTMSIVYMTNVTTSPRMHSVEPNTTAFSRYIVKITSITAGEIEGSFTGNFLYDSASDETLNITEGQFKVKRIR
jgi:hypothetical protein